MARLVLWRYSPEEGDGRRLLYSAKQIIMIRKERRTPIVPYGETIGLECTQYATGEDHYVETIIMTGGNDVAASKPHGIVVIESTRTKNGKLSFCK